MEGDSCLPRKESVVAGWRWGLARGLQSLASVESCCSPKSLAYSPAHEGDVMGVDSEDHFALCLMLGRGPAGLCLGWHTDIYAYSPQSATMGSYMCLVATTHA